MVKNVVNDLCLLVDAYPTRIMSLVKMQMGKKCKWVKLGPPLPILK